MTLKDVYAYARTQPKGSYGAYEAVKSRLRLLGLTELAYSEAVRKIANIIRV